MADEPRNLDLEAAIFADPTDFEAFRVLGDWLEEQGDVRAELLRLQMEWRRKPSKPERALFNKHHHELVGLLSKSRHVAWRYGFVSDLAIDYSDVLALDHASSRFLTLLIVYGLMPDTRPLAARLARTLRAISIYGGPGTPFSIDPLWPALNTLPHLVRLDIAGPFDLFGAVIPSVAALRLVWAGNATAAIATLADRRPPLVELSLEGIVDPAAVTALIGDCALTQLTVRTPQVDLVIASLATKPAAATIQTLVLDRSDLGRDGVDVLIAQRRAFCALHTVNVRACTLDDGNAFYEELEALDLEVIGDRYDDVDE